MNSCFVFDLDGTITNDEILPIIATKLGLEQELTLLTKLTIEGIIPFDESFKLRFALLKSIPSPSIRDIVQQVSLNDDIVNFIKTHRKRCFIATGNIKNWIKPILDKIGCNSFTSTADEDNYGLLHNLKILRKNKAVLSLRNKFDPIVVIGDSFNDLPMFEATDISVAYGGVHNPVPDVIGASDYICYNSNALCRLLITLS